jgi:predicted nicotinamide N-methyase
MTEADRIRHRAFVETHCRLLPVPLVPEISLYLAHEALPLWRKTEAELDALGLPLPFWAFAWAGGQALARYILDHPHRVEGRRVLDFATGSGLVAIAARMAGAELVVAADIDPYAIVASGLNAAANGVEIDTRLGDLLQTHLPPCDMIIAGDIFYEQPLAEQAMARFATARAAGADVLIGDPQRSYFPVDTLVRLEEYSVPVTRELEDSEIKRTAVWQLADPA